MSKKHNITIKIKYLNIVKRKKLLIGGVKMALVVKSAVRALLKGMRASEDFFKALDERVQWKVKRALERAKANGRKTVRGHDL
jgi:histone H3/H4